MKNTAIKLNHQPVQIKHEDVEKEHRRKLVIMAANQDQQAAVINQLAGIVAALQKIVTP